MKFNFNNRYVRWAITAIFVIIAGICFYYLMFHGANIRKAISDISKIFMPILLGFITAYLLTPILNHVEYLFLLPICNKLKIKESKKRNSIVRGIGILITVFLFFALIYILISMLLSEIVPSIVNIINNFDVYIDNTTKWINGTLENNPELGKYVIKNKKQTRYSG